MSKDIFGSMPTAIPRSSPNVERVDLTALDARASGSKVPKLQKNPKNAVTHVTQGR